MNIPQIRIDQTFAKLSMQVDRGGFDIQQPHAKVDIKNNLPIMEVYKENGELHIDQSKALAAYGLMNPVIWTTRIHEHVMAVDVLQGIANIAQNGDALADVGRRNTTVADIAKQNSLKEKKLNVVGEASNLNVAIHYNPNTIETRLKEGYPDIQITPQKPITDYKPSKLNIENAQYQSISINWVGLQVDLRV